MLQGIFDWDSGKSEVSYEAWATSLKRDCSRRQRSVRRTFGRDSLSWPTPRAGENENRMTKPSPSQLAHKHGKALAAEAAVWPTPDANVAQEGERAETWLARRELLRQKHRNGNGCGTPLAMAAQMWATPQTHDVAPGDPARVGRYGTEHGGRNLNDEAAAWPTRSRLFLQAPRTPMPGAASSKSSRVLNPLFVAWLMGFPPTWANPDCAIDQISFAAWETRWSLWLRRMLSACSTGDFQEVM